MSPIFWHWVHWVKRRAHRQIIERKWWILDHKARKVEWKSDEIHSIRKS